MATTSNNSKDEGQNFTEETLKGFDNIFKMLSCVKCGKQPRETIYVLGGCEHKYCELCKISVAGNECIVCDKISTAKEAVPDLLTSKVLAELRIMESLMKNKQHGQDMSNNSPSLRHDDEQKPHEEDKLSLQNKLDYPTKSRLSPQNGEKEDVDGGANSTGEKVTVLNDDPQKGTSDEEEVDELLSLDVKCDSPSSKIGLKMSLNVSKLKRKISQIYSSSDDETKNDDLLESKNKTMVISPRVSRISSTRSSASSSRRSSRVVSSLKRDSIKGISKPSLKRYTANKAPNKVNSRTGSADKVQNETGSDVDLFEIEDNINISDDKGKVESPPCLTPYITVQKTSNATFRTGLHSTLNTSRKRSRKIMLEQSKKQNKNDATTSGKDEEETENIIGKKEDIQDDRSPPALTPYGKVISARKSKRFAAAVEEGVNGDTPKAIEKEKGYIETPKPEKKKAKKTLLNPLKINNPKTPDSRAKTLKTPQSETTTIIKGSRARKHSSSSVASSTPSLASTSVSSGSVASVDKRNPKGETGLHVACRAGHLEKVKQLIAAGADINAQDNAGWTPLHEALNEKSNYRFEIVSLLCQQGCNTNIPGMFNECAIHEAARSGYLDIVKLLLSHSASPNVRNSLGKLPRELTTSEEVIEVLDKASGFSPGNNNLINSPSSDDPVVLEIQFSKALIYFNYDVLSDTVEAVKSNLKLKVSKTLGEDVTHIIFPITEDHEEGVKVNFSFEYLFGVASGAWMLSSKWIEESISIQKLIPPKAYEVQGCVGMDQMDAPTKSRINKEVGNPGLFHGMSFFLYKNCFFEKIGKKELEKLIKKADGCVVRIEPNPNSVDPFETLTRFHAKEPNHKLVLTSHVVLYNGKNEPPADKKYNMEHLKVLNTKWLIDSIGSFQLVDPEEYL